MTPTPQPNPQPPEQSRTPRTDAELLDEGKRLGFSSPSDYVSANFARQLETALAQAVREREEAADERNRHLNGGKEWCRIANEALEKVAHLEAENAELLAQLAEAKKDGERLDWLETGASPIEPIIKGRVTRAAIDAAMSAQKETQ